MPQTTTTPRYVRPTEAAKYAGVSRATFWRLVKENPDFPKLKQLSERVSLIDLNELDAYLNR